MPRPAVLTRPVEVIVTFTASIDPAPHKREPETLRAATETKSERELEIEPETTTEGPVIEIEPELAEKEPEIEKSHKATKLMLATEDKNEPEMIRESEMLTLGDELLIEEVGVTTSERKSYEAPDKVAKAPPSTKISNWEDETGQLLWGKGVDSEDVATFASLSIMRE